MSIHRRGLNFDWAVFESIRILLFCKMGLQLWEMQDQRFVQEFLVGLRRNEVSSASKRVLQSKLTSIAAILPFMN